MSTSPSTPDRVEELSAVLAETEARLANLRSKRETTAARAVTLSEQIAAALVDGTNAKDSLREREGLPSLADLDRALDSLSGKLTEQKTALEVERKRVHIAALFAEGVELTKDAPTRRKDFAMCYGELAEAVRKIGIHNAQVGAVHAEAPEAFAAGKDPFVYLDSEAVKAYATVAPGPEGPNTPRLNVDLPLR